LPKADNEGTPNVKKLKVSMKRLIQVEQRVHSPNPSEEGNSDACLRQSLGKAV